MPEEKANPEMVGIEILEDEKEFSCHEKTLYFGQILIIVNNLIVITVKWDIEYEKAINKSRLLEKVTGFGRRIYSNN